MSHCPFPKSDFLLRAVGELESVGLSHVAKVVLEFAEAAPDEASLCPYDPVEKAVVSRAAAVRRSGARAAFTARIVQLPEGKCLRSGIKLG